MALHGMETSSDDEGRRLVGPAEGPAPRFPRSARCACAAVSLIAVMAVAGVLDMPQSGRSGAPAFRPSPGALRVGALEQLQDAPDFGAGADGASEVVSGAITAATSDNADDRNQAAGDMVAGAGHTCLAVAGVATMASAGVGLPATACCAPFVIVGAGVSSVSDSSPSTRDLLDAIKDLSAHMDERFNEIEDQLTDMQMDEKRELFERIQSYYTKMVELLTHDVTMAGFLSYMPDGQQLTTMGSQLDKRDLQEYLEILRKRDLSPATVYSGVFQFLKTRTQLYSMEVMEFAMINDGLCPKGELELSTNAVNTTESEYQQVMFDWLESFSLEDYPPSDVGVLRDLASVAPHLPDSVVHFHVTSKNSTSGALSDLPEGVKSITLDCIEGSMFASVNECPKITGDLGMLPDSVEEISLEYNDQITGDLSDLKESVQVINLGNNEIIKGDLSDLKDSLREINLNGNEQITGHLSDLPSSLRVINLRNNEYITGDLSDLKDSVQVINLRENEHITGDLSDLKDSMREINLNGNEQITGHLSDLPSSLREIDLRNNHQVTGNLSDLPSSVKKIFIGDEQILNHNTEVTGACPSGVECWVTGPVWSGDPSDPIKLMPVGRVIVRRQGILSIIVPGSR